MKKSIFVALMGLGMAARCWSATAPEIVSQVKAKYAEMTSLAATGRVVMDIDTGDGKTPAPKSDELKYDTGKPGMLTTFSVRLGRPDLYRIEWAREMTPEYTDKGAAWSAGSGYFLSIGGRKMPKNDNMNLALAAATGVSGGVAGTLPGVFFKSEVDVLKAMENPTMLPEGKIGDDSCQVVSGEINGQKMIFWVTKDYLIKQRRLVIGGGSKPQKMPEMKEEDIKKALKGTGQEATPEAVARMKAMMKDMPATVSKMKGSITETYDKIEVNPAMKAEMFDYEKTPGGKK